MKGRGADATFHDISPSAWANSISYHQRSTVLRPSIM